MVKINNNKFNEELIKMKDSIESYSDPAEETLNNAVEEKEQNEAKAQKDLLDIIIEESGGELTYDTINEWKEMYNGKVYAIRFDENDSYIFRYISRIEMKKLIAQLQKSKIQSEEMLNEMIFDTCVLYPKITPDLKAVIGAGTIDTVAEQIKIQSNYIPVEIAIQLVKKL